MSTCFPIILIIIVIKITLIFSNCNCFNSLFQIFSFCSFFLIVRAVFAWLLLCFHISFWVLFYVLTELPDGKHHKLEMDQAVLSVYNELSNELVVSWLSDHCYQVSVNYVKLLHLVLSVYSPQSSYATTELNYWGWQDATVIKMDETSNKGIVVANFINQYLVKNFIFVPFFKFLCMCVQFLLLGEFHTVVLQGFKFLLKYIYIIVKVSITLYIIFIIWLRSVTWCFFLNLVNCCI